MFSGFWKYYFKQAMCLIVVEIQEDFKYNRKCLEIMVISTVPFQQPEQKGG